MLYANIGIIIVDWLLTGMTIRTGKEAHLLKLARSRRQEENGSEGGLLMLCYLYPYPHRRLLE